MEEGRELSPEQVREVYLQFLLQRLENASVFLNQIEHERKNII